MSSDDLACFALVARAGSFSRAALESGSNQSTISRQIAALEAGLGVRLFHRSGRGVVLTDRGRELQQYADTVAGTLEAASRAMGVHADQGPVRLRIAAQPTIAQVMFGELGHALHRRFPGTRIRFVEGLASHLLKDLHDGEIDLALLYRPEHPGALTYDPLLQEGMHLVAPAGYPVGEGPFPVARLGEVPLIMPSTHHGIRVLVEALATRHGFVPRIALECDGSVAITRRLVMQGCGCTLLPLAAVADDVRAGQLLSRPLASPPVCRTVGVVLGRNSAGAAGLWEATRLVKDLVVRQVQQGRWPGTVLDAALAGAQPGAGPDLREPAGATGG
ncbi:LysR family transcriptional regulator [Ramlibacter sp. MAH-25]|uniref:LysR family transcriptional regulator n=1 Tax=Ramlibacter pinisoli TaxID=2682844 RepID=A0A6N8IVP5_9BURK|nr:LysR family transcriptional regulator [Ramlibacter sp. CGMCC 1.13660]MVQ31021.1 LysR family transcriptional regulator [Ramlibacter pinisoli]